MVKCHLCGRKLFSFKKIDSAELLECQKCRIITIIDNHSHKKKLKELYSLKNYLNESKRLRKVLTEQCTIVQRSNNKLKKGRNGVKILDVGCGFGLFDSLLVDRFLVNNLATKKTTKDSGLRKDSEKVVELEVIEPTQKPYFLKNIPHKLHKISFEKFLKTNRKKYDFVIMMDVLEHFKNPSENMKETLKLLAKDGKLVIQTPNYQSLMAKICKNWSWWMPEDHKYVFSVNSLKKILNKNGFKIEYLRTYEDLYSFKKNFDGNFTEIKPKIWRLILKAITYGLFFPLYLILRPIMWRLNYGGLIFLVARK